MADRPVCFVIAPIGKEGTDVRARSDKVLKHIIAPVVEELGYEPVRADKISEPGLITTHVINHILNDPMVVADLTDHNANVFYELAVRHAIRKPYVQIIQNGESGAASLPRSVWIQELLKIPPRSDNAVVNDTNNKIRDTNIKVNEIDAALGTLKASINRGLSDIDTLRKKRDESANYVNNDAHTKLLGEQINTEENAIQSQLNRLDEVVTGVRRLATPVK